MYAQIFAFIVYTIVPVVVRLLKGLGISFIVYQGVDTALTAALSHVQSAMSGLTSDILTLANLLGIPHGVSMIISAYGAAIWYTFTAKAAARVLIKEQGLG